MIFNMLERVLGQSVLGAPLRVCFNFDPQDFSAVNLSSPLTLLIGGTHGDEKATVQLLENYIVKLTDAHSAHTQTLPPIPPLAIIPLLNPDGYAQNTRYNARGVDLNRNFTHSWSADSEEPSGSHPLSEPESKFLHDFILQYRPSKIVSLHWALAEIEADGAHSHALAKALWNSLSAEEQKPYRLRLPMPKPNESVALTPGSLGSWIGYHLNYAEALGQDRDRNTVQNTDHTMANKAHTRPAMVTLELPYNPHITRPKILPESHWEEVQMLWKNAPDTYLQGVESGVHKMLQAAVMHNSQAQL